MPLRRKGAHEIEEQVFFPLGERRSGLVENQHFDVVAGERLKHGDDFALDSGEIRNFPIEVDRHRESGQQRFGATAQIPPVNPAEKAWTIALSSEKHALVARQLAGELGVLLHSCDPAIDGVARGVEGYRLTVNLDRAHLLRIDA